MANTRRAAAVGGRIVSGVVGLALAGAAIFAAGTVQLPDLGREAPRTSVTPEGASQLRACAGPLLQLASTDTALAAVQDETRFALNSGQRQRVAELARLMTRAGRVIQDLALLNLDNVFSSVEIRGGSVAACRDRFFASYCERIIESHTPTDDRS